MAAGALGTVQAGDKRGQLMKLDGATIINDCYNSNPKALHFMIDTLAGMTAQRRILVAGEMLELGPTGEKLHADAGRHAAEKKIDLVIGVRGLGKALVEAASAAGAKARYAETPEEAGELLAKELRPGDAVLLKASRGVKLENAIDAAQRINRDVSASSRSLASSGPLGRRERSE